MPRPTHMCEAWPPSCCQQPYICAHDGCCRGCQGVPSHTDLMVTPEGLNEYLDGLSSKELQAIDPIAPGFADAVSRLPPIQAMTEECIDDGKGGCINPWCPQHGV